MADMGEEIWFLQNDWLIVIQMERTLKMILNSEEGEQEYSDLKSVYSFFKW